MNTPMTNAVSRAEVEDLLYHEADLLDSWKLDDWLALMTDDATYYVPPNDKPDADHRYTLFTIADDIVRLRERIIRLKDPRIRRPLPPQAPPPRGHAEDRRAPRDPRCRGARRARFGELYFVAVFFGVIARESGRSSKRWRS